MSVETLIRTRGSTITIKRATRTRDAADNSSKATWGTVVSGVKLLIQPLSGGRAQRFYGRELKATFQGFAIAGVDVLEDDGILVTAGYRAGDRYQVEQKLDPDQGPRHIAVALLTTTETFT